MLRAASCAARATATAGLVVLACGVASGRVRPWFDALPVDVLIGQTSLETAHQVQPRDTSVSIRLALRAEGQGDSLQAERILLRAAELDHQFLPAWTLTNFYFRQGNPDGFWMWAGRSAAITPHDPRPIVRMAARLESDPIVVADRLGRRPLVLRGQLDDLIGTGRLDAAMAIARLLAQYHDPSDALRLASLARNIAASRAAKPHN